MTAIVLVSGGMDSCVTAAIARDDSERLALLHVSYGQRTEVRERRAFNDIADHYAVKERLDVSIALNDKRFSESRRPSRGRPRSLRKQRSEGRLLFIVLVLALALAIIWIATHLNF